MQPSRQRCERQRRQVVTDNVDVRLGFLALEDLLCPFRYVVVRACRREDLRTEMNSGQRRTDFKNEAKELVTSEQAMSWCFTEGYGNTWKHSCNLHSPGVLIQVGKNY
jgi:hypothetical protein